MLNDKNDFELALMVLVLNKNDISNQIRNNG